MNIYSYFHISYSENKVKKSDNDINIIHKKKNKIVTFLRKKF